MANIVILGTTKTAEFLARGAIAGGGKISAIISLIKEKWPNNSIDLKPFANSIGAEFYEIQDINKEQKLLKKLSPDILVCNWPKMISQEIINCAKIALCPHGTDVPANRGRHMLHYSIVLGLKQSAISFFVPNSGIDTGPLIHKEPYFIDKLDDINSLNLRLNFAAFSGMKKVVEQELYKKEPQEQKGVGNYWQKRTLHDVALDLRFNFSTIDRIVKSFAPPYPSAKLFIEDHSVGICAAYKFSVDFNITNFMHGQIFAAHKDFIIAKCDDCLVLLKATKSGEFGFLADFGVKLLKDLDSIESCIESSAALNDATNGAAQIQRERERERETSAISQIYKQLQWNLSQIQLLRDWQRIYQNLPQIYKQIQCKSYKNLYSKFTARTNSKKSELQNKLYKFCKMQITAYHNRCKITRSKRAYAFAHLPFT